MLFLFFCSVFKLYDDFPFFFQAGSSSHNGKLPEIPPRENIYGVHVMRFKEAAGKKMQKLRKNWSLRKNDISNKLSRMRRKSSVDPRGATILCKKCTDHIAL